MTYSQLWRRLLPLYDEREAKAVVRTLLEERFNLTLTDLYTDGLDRLTDDEKARMETLIERLEAGEPVQYVVGKARFCGRDYMVAPGVLIPRPETEMLCKEVISAYNKPYCALQPPEPLRVLDIGTGSGCIAVTLALDLWNSTVTAWDISGDALILARENAHRLQVSNPPYICARESKDMAKHVLAHEPHTALFVPDDDPLLFYRSIAHYGLSHLKPSGMLAFEINPIYAEEICKILEHMGYEQIERKEDQYGKERIVIARIT